MMPMDLKTEKGLKFFTYGFTLYIIALIVLLIMLGAFFGMAANLLEEPDDRAIRDAREIFDEGSPTAVAASTNPNTAPAIQLDTNYDISLRVVGGSYQGTVRFTPEEEATYYIFLEHNYSEVAFTLTTTTGAIVAPEKTGEHDSEPFEWHGSYDLEMERTYVLNFGPTMQENVEITVIQAYDPFQDESFLASFFSMIGGLCLGLLFMIISLILFLIGLISINNGRREFGEPHSSSAHKGLIYIVVAVVISLFGGMGVGLIPGVAGGVASSVVSVIAAILMALGLIFLIQELCDDSGKTMLKLAGMLYIIITIITSIVTVWLFATYGLYDISTDQQAAEEDLGNVLAVAMIPMAIGSLQLISILIFLFVFRRTYLRVRNREITPVIAPYLQPYPGAYPQAYPPYPGQYPPGYPPTHPPGQPPYYPSGPQPQPETPTPTEGETKPKEQEKVKPVRSTEAKPSEIVQCTFCGVNIPRGIPTCPVCGKGQESG